MSEIFFLQFLLFGEGGEFFFGGRGEVSWGEILLVAKFGGRRSRVPLLRLVVGVLLCVHQSSGCGDGEEEEEDVHGVVLLL